MVVTPYFSARNVVSLASGGYVSPAGPVSQVQSWGTPLFGNEEAFSTGLNDVGDAWQAASAVAIIAWCGATIATNGVMSVTASGGGGGVVQLTGAGTIGLNLSSAGSASLSIAVSVEGTTAFAAGLAATADVGLLYNATIAGWGGGGGSSLTTTQGSNANGPYTQYDVNTGGTTLETQLQGNVLTVDWVSGQNPISALGQIQTAAGGPGSFTTIQGYVTDQLATLVTQQGYLQRLVQAVSSRLGGQWTAQLQSVGSRTYLTLTRTP